MTVKEANEPGTQLCLHYSGFDRGAKPEEIGYLVAFLLSTQADFINGAVIPIDGGQSYKY